MKRIILLLLLAGCEESTLSIQKTWIGNTTSDLMAARGAPDLTASTDRGGRVLTYVTRWNRRECRENFTADVKGSIIYVSNDCPS